MQRSTAGNVHAVIKFCCYEMISTSWKRRPPKADSTSKFKQAEAWQVLYAKVLNKKTILSVRVSVEDYVEPLYSEYLGTRKEVPDYCMRHLYSGVEVCTMSKNESFGSSDMFHYTQPSCTTLSPLALHSGLVHYTQPSCTTLSPRALHSVLLHYTQPSCTTLSLRALHSISITCVCTTYCPLVEDHGT